MAGGTAGQTYSLATAIFNFHSQAPPVNIISGAGLGAALEHCPYGPGRGRRVPGPPWAERKGKRSVASGEAAFTLTFLLFIT